VNSILPNARSRREEDSLRLIKIRQQGGVATMLDVRQGEELVYQASQIIPDTERLIEQTRTRLVCCSAITRADSSGPIAKQSAGTAAVPAGLPSSLLERRPDIRAQKRIWWPRTLLFMLPRRPFSAH